MQAEDYSLSIEVGISIFNITATTKTTATQFSAKTVLRIAGRILKICGFWVKPIPMERDKEVMIKLRSVKPHLAIIRIPLITIEPNIIIVQPPKTGSGKEAKSTPSAGIKPHRIIITAPVIMAKRFITWVIATKPMF